MTRSITVREPEYSLRDQAQLLADWERENEPRGTHGHPLAAAKDPANAGRWIVDLPETDFAQVALDKARAAYLGSGDLVQYPDALIWKLRMSGELTPGLGEGPGHEDQDDRDDQGAKSERDVVREEQRHGEDHGDGGEHAE